MNNRYLLLVIFIVLVHSTLFAQDKCQMMFYDDFIDSRNSWSIENIENQVSCSISGGYYYIEGFQRKQARMHCLLMDIDDNKNFEIEVSIKNISGANKNGFGIGFGLLDAKNFFGFKINNKNKYKLYKFEDGKMESIIPWTKSEYINQGTGSTNKLKIKKEGEKMKLFINDHFIASSPFQNFFGNGVGFVVDRKQKVAVDYIRVIYQPVR